MITTILPGSTNFHAVGYNEHKVSKGVARLIEIQNFSRCLFTPIMTRRIPIFILSLREWHLMEERFSTAMNADVLKKS